MQCLSFLISLMPQEGISSFGSAALKRGFLKVCTVFSCFKTAFDFYLFLIMLGIRCKHKIHCRCSLRCLDERNVKIKYTALGLTIDVHARKRRTDQQDFLLLLGLCQTPLHYFTSQNLIHCGALVAWSQGGDHEPQHPQLHATPIISLASFSAIFPLSKVYNAQERRYVNVKTLF